MRKKNFLKIFLVVMMIIVSGGITIAWLSTSLSNSISATASVHKAYFRGKGTEQEPYLIEAPSQLYYFSWLQDLGYFNDSQPNGVSKEAPVYFEVTNDLDMVDYILPPAGTIEKPFIGYFNGNGKTISNLTVSTSATASDLTDVPNDPRNNNIAKSDYQIIGVFGVIGEINGDYSAQSFTPTVKDLNIDSTTVYAKNPEQNKTLIGVLAGYVNGVVSGCTVASSTVKVNSSGLSTLSYTENLSDYSLIGYCTEPYLKNLDVKKVSFKTPTETENMLYKNTQAEGAAFGGSMKLDGLYSRILGAVQDTNAPTTQYTSAETIYYDEVNDVEMSKEVTATATPSPASGVLRYFSSEANGATSTGEYYVIMQSNSTRFLYLMAAHKSVTYVRYKDEYEQGFTISNGTYYLNISSSRETPSASSIDTITTNSVTNGPTGWVRDNSGHIYTYTTEGYKCYLNATNTLTTSRTGSTVFTLENDGSISYTYNNTKWYITYSDGWKVSPGKVSYYIHYNNNYLYRSGTTTVGNTTSTTNQYREWVYDDVNGKLSVVYNNTAYYLYANNGALAANTNANTASTHWYVDETNNRVYYTDNNGVNWYIRYNNGTWSLFPSINSYRINSGTNYLYRSSTTAVGSNTTGSEWGYDDTTHKLFTNNGATIYYLYCGDNGTLALTTNKATATTEWIFNNDNTISFEKNDHTWYLRCVNGTWNAYPAKTTYYICEGNNYLNNNGTTGVASSTTASTEWVIDQTNGTIQMLYNGSLYYLVVNNSNQLAFSNTSDTTWVFNNDNTLQTTKDGRTLYLQNVNNSWRLFPAKSGSYIYSGTNYLVNNGTTGVKSDIQANANDWIIDEANHTISIFNNGTMYYLVVNANNKLALSNTSSTLWTINNNNTISTTISNVAWYLRCVEGNWEIYPSQTSITIFGSNSNNYLNYENGQIVTNQNQDDATHWLIDNDGYIYYVSDGTFYYLNGEGSLSVSTNKVTSWTHNNDGTLSYQYDNKTWYLYDLEGIWTTNPARVLYFIVQNGKYLAVGSNNSVIGVENMFDANSWSYDENTGYLSTLYNGTYYYLNGSSYNVSLSNTQASATSWEINEDDEFIFSIGLQTWYLIYDGGWTAYQANELYYLDDGSHYLGHSGSSLHTFNDVLTATSWLKSGDKYYFISNGTPYYLVVTSNGFSVSQSLASGTNIYYNSTKQLLYFTDSITGDDYYIFYDEDNDEWAVEKTTTSGIIIGNGSYYINVETSGSTKVVDKTNSSSSATLWQYNGTSGTISTIIDGETYYLRGELETVQKRSSTNLTITNNLGSATNWTYDNNHNLSCYLSVRTGNNTTNVQYFIVFENNTWKLMNTSANYYIICTYTDNHYLNATDSHGLTSNTVEDEATLWTFSNTSNPSSGSYISLNISTINGGTTYYLSVPTSNGQSCSLSTNQSTIRFTYGNGTYYYLKGDTRQNRYASWRYNIWQTYNTASNSVNRLIRTQISFTKANITLTEVEVESTLYLTNSSYFEDLDVSTFLEEQNCENISYQNVNENLTINRTNHNYGTLTYTERTYSTLNYSNTNYLTYTVDEVNNVTLTLTDKTIQKIVRDDAYDMGSEKYGTAIPISANDTSPYDAKEENTGYIVSGWEVGNTTSTIKEGSIRVSEYYTNDIYVSLTTNNSKPDSSFNYSDTYNKRLELLTRVKYGDYNNWYRVSDSYNGSNSTVNNALSSYSKVSYENLGLTRYADARGKLTEMFLNKTNIYGLHFMDTSIDKNNYYTLAKARVIGEEKTNYKVPLNSIDFNVQMRGYITLFAGTYFGGNNSFFSLHEIFRDENDDIIEIKEISKIYSTSGNDYVYQYSDGSYSSDKGRVDLLFDMSWMTNPSSIVNNAVYYFEIPVNKGEYALGSVSGKVGAYLFYLDIGANGGQTDDRIRTTITEQYKVEEFSAIVPEGIQLVESGQTFNEDNPYELVTIILDNTFKDEYLLTRTGNVVTNQNKSGSSIDYVDGALSMTSGSGVYYPNGYMIKTIENITDIVVNASNEVTLTDKMILETIDYYDQNGDFDKREVTLYAGLDVTADLNNLVKIITFSYTPNSNDSTYVRATRASSYAGFNIAFNEATTISLTSSSIESDAVHVNFGPNNGATLISYSKAEISGNTSVNVPLVDLSGASDNATAKNLYYRSVIGSDLGSFYYTTEYGSDDETKETKFATLATFTSELGPTFTIPSGNVSQTLSYDFTLTPSSGTVNVYGNVNKNSDTTGYSSYIVDYSANPIALVNKTIAYSTITVKVNDETLEVDNG